MVYNPLFFLPFTDKILLLVYDKDTCLEDFQNEFLENRLASSKDEMNQGRNTMLVSRSILFSLDTIIEKQKYLVDCIYESFLSYFKKFKIASEGLSQSYLRLKKFDFYFITNKRHPYKKTNLFVCIQNQKDIDKNRYRFVLKDIITNEILDLHQLPTRETTHNILHELDWIKASDKKILPAHSFQIIGWKREKFFFEFGYKGPTDYFEYDIKTKTLKQEINTNKPINYELPKVKKEEVVDWKFGRFLSEDYITFKLEKEFMPSKQNIQDFFKSKNIEIEFVNNDESLSPSKSLNFIKDEEILLEKGNLLGILMYLEKNKNTYEWKLMNFSNEPEILDLLVFDFFDDINFISIQSGDFFLFTK